MATSTSTENERLAREHFERAWNRGEFDEGVLADDFRAHTNLGERETHSLAEFRGFVEAARSAMPDLRKEPEDVFATEDLVTIRYAMTGTHEGEFMEVPPTGESVEIEAVAVYRVDDGVLAEAWYVADVLRAMRQLGVAD